jgi:hypothetical protein
MNLDFQYFWMGMIAFGDKHQVHHDTLLFRQKLNLAIIRRGQPTISLVYPAKKSIYIVPKLCDNQSQVPK